MKALMPYDYSPSPAGLAAQGHLLRKGTEELSVDVYSVRFESAQEKEWYYRWFEPDIVVGVGYWGHTPHLVIHPRRYGVQPVPWLVADGYMANYHEILDALPLILVTSKWVKGIYKRDGLSGDNIEVLPVGCDTDSFCPSDKTDTKAAAARGALGVAADRIMILTIGGGATSKGAQEVMQALAINDTKAPDWMYLCKVWPQPGTAWFGYPEAYTPDVLICSPGILVCENQKLIKSLKRVLETLAKNQGRVGHIPSLVHDPQDRGSCDTTPLFLMAVGLYRKAAGESGFLAEAVDKSLLRIEYQSLANSVLAAQLPTTDWRDEQWVPGYGLYVNSAVYTYLKLLGLDERAKELADSTGRFTVKGERQQRYVLEGPVLRFKPCYALWSDKVYRSARFDLLGNSLAILSGIAHPSRAKKLIGWIEKESAALRAADLLAVDMPPVLFPYIRPEDPDWRQGYEKYNQPGEYHNGGIWPFVCGFYIAALVAAKRYRLAEEKLITLAELVKPARQADVEFGFNEWIRAQDGTPQGEDWQSRSVAMYLYAAHCVRHKETPFFEDIR